MKVLGPHRVNDGTGLPKPRHACIPNQCVQTLSCTRARTQTHILPASTNTHLTCFGHQVHVDTLRLPAGTLHVEGGAAGPRVAPRTCRADVSREGSQDLPGSFVCSQALLQGHDLNGISQGAAVKVA